MKGLTRKELLGIACIALGLLLLFGVYIWPTRYSYDHMRTGDVSLLIRIDRFSGKADILIPGKGWIDAETEEKSDP